MMILKIVAIHKMKYCGHENQVDIFSRSIKSSRLHQAYIFSGIEGIGKRLAAMNIAKSLFCDRGSYFSDCECNNCKMVDNNSYPDLYLFNKENLLIDNIREMITEISMTASIGSYKIIIIDDAELLSSTNQVVVANALLKTLEEPTDDTIFFLITDRYDQILPTVRSRAINIQFSPLKDFQVKEILQNLYPERTFIDTAVFLAFGSVTKALDIIDSNIVNLAQFINDKDYIKLVESIRSISDKKSLYISIANIYPYILDRYKTSGKYELSELSYYTMDILKRLNYNTNIDLIKADLSSKLIEVFSEAV